MIKELTKWNAIYRVVALSATPGTDIQAVRLVLQNLLISNIELRNEESPDIVPYTFARTIEKVVVKLDDELKKVWNGFKIRLVNQINSVFLQNLFKKSPPTLVAAMGKASGSVTVQLTTCLTDFDWAAWYIEIIKTLTCLFGSNQKNMRSVIQLNFPLQSFFDGHVSDGQIFDNHLFDYGTYFDRNSWALSTQMLINHLKRPNRSNVST